MQAGTGPSRGDGAQQQQQQEEEVPPPPPRVPAALRHGGPALRHAPVPRPASGPAPAPPSAPTPPSAPPPAPAPAHTGPAPPPAPAPGDTEADRVLAARRARWEEEGVRFPHLVLARGHICGC